MADLKMLDDNELGLLCDVHSCYKIQEQELKESLISKNLISLLQKLLIDTEKRQKQLVENRKNLLRNTKKIYNHTLPFTTKHMRYRNSFFVLLK